MKTIPKTVNVTDLADMLGISCDTVRKWRKDGMPHKKSGKSLMFDLSAVQAWLNKTRKYKYIPVLLKELGEEPVAEVDAPTDDEAMAEILADVDSFYERTQKMEVYYYGKFRDDQSNGKDYYADKYQGWATLRAKLEKDLDDIRARRGDYYHKTDVERDMAEAGQITQRAVMSFPSAINDRLEGLSSDDRYKVLVDGCKDLLRGMSHVSE